MILCAAFLSQPRAYYVEGNPKAAATVYSDDIDDLVCKGAVDIPSCLCQDFCGR